MRKFSGLRLSVAYPGTLGSGLADPPPGRAWLLDENGAILLDDNGLKISVPVSNA